MVIIISIKKRKITRTRRISKKRKKRKKKDKKDKHKDGLMGAAYGFGHEVKDTLHYIS